MPTALLERRSSVTRSNKIELLSLTQAMLGKDIPELSKASTSSRALEILHARLTESIPDELRKRIDDFLAKHDK